jgi:hypothetical protein
MCHMQSAMQYWLPHQLRPEAIEMGDILEGIGQPIVIQRKMGSRKMAWAAATSGMEKESRCMP